MKHATSGEPTTKILAALLTMAMAGLAACSGKPSPAATAAPTQPAATASPTPVAPAPAGAPAPVENPTAASSPGAAPPATTTTGTPAAMSASAPAGATSAPTATTAAPAGAAAAPAPAASPAPEPAPPRIVTLRAGRPIAVFTTATLSTKTSHTGATFVATLAEPIVDGDWVIAKKGARVQGVIVDADEGHRVKGVASIAVTLKSLALADGRTITLSASQVRHEAKATKGKDAAKIGIASGIGAAIGGIAGGGKGAAIGAGVGGGAGTGVVLSTRGDPAVIPAETRLRFTLRSPVTITEQRAP